MSDKLDNDSKGASLCVTLWHDWSKALYLCPQHNGTTYEYCRTCGVMRLSDESREFMNENNKKAVL